jgi:hypothetical protein
MLSVFSYQIFMTLPVFTIFWVVTPCSLGGGYQLSRLSCFHRDSVAGIVPRLWTGVSRVGILAGAREISLKCVDHCWGPLGFLFIGYWGSFWE